MNAPLKFSSNSQVLTKIPTSANREFQIADANSPHSASPVLPSKIFAPDQTQIVQTWWLSLRSSTKSGKVQIALLSDGTYVAINSKGKRIPVGTVNDVLPEAIENTKKRFNQNEIGDLFPKQSQTASKPNSILSSVIDPVKKFFTQETTRTYTKNGKTYRVTTKSIANEVSRIGNVSNRVAGAFKNSTIPGTPLAIPVIAQIGEGLDMINGMVGSVPDLLRQGKKDGVGIANIAKGKEKFSLTDSLWGAHTGAGKLGRDGVLFGADIVTRVAVPGKWHDKIMGGLNNYAENSFGTYETELKKRKWVNPNSTSYKVPSDTIELVGNVVIGGKVHGKIKAKINAPKALKQINANSGTTLPPIPKSGGYPTLFQTKITEVFSPNTHPMGGKPKIPKTSTIKPVPVSVRASNVIQTSVSNKTSIKATNDPFEAPIERGVKSPYENSNFKPRDTNWAEIDPSLSANDAQHLSSFFEPKYVGLKDAAEYINAYKQIKTAIATTPNLTLNDIQSMMFVSLKKGILDLNLAIGRAKSLQEAINQSPYRDRIKFKDFHYPTSFDSLAGTVFKGMPAGKAVKVIEAQIQSLDQYHPGGNLHYLQFEIEKTNVSATQAAKNMELTKQEAIKRGVNSNEFNNMNADRVRQKKSPQRIAHEYGFEQAVKLKARLLNEPSGVRLEDYYRMKKRGDFKKPLDIDNPNELENLVREKREYIKYSRGAHNLENRYTINSTGREKMFDPALSSKQNIAAFKAKHCLPQVIAEKYGVDARDKLEISKYASELNTLQRIKLAEYLKAHPYKSTDLTYPVDAYKLTTVSPEHGITDYGNQSN